MATLYLPSSGGYESSSVMKYRIKVVEGAISGRTRSVTISVEYYRTNTGYTSYGSGTCYCKINGTVYTQAISSSQKVTYNSMTPLFTKTMSVSYDNNGNASLEIYAYSDCSNGNIDSDTYKGGTISLTNIGKATYTISYKGSTNDAYGYPASQTKTYGVALTLSTHTPARTGYTFKNWNTAQNGTGTTYAPGANYTTNANLTLYSQWTVNTYTVSYNANGGTGAPANQTKTYGSTLTLSSTKPTRTNYNFVGWATSSTATTATYFAGGSYDADAAVTLYAVWELAYTKPRITDLSVYRADSSGVASDDGTYFKVSFNWATDETISSITVSWKVTSVTTWTSSTISASGTSGTVSSILGAGAISIDSSYDIQIIVTDSVGSTTVTSGISSKVFPIDVLPEHKGIAFGKAATTNDLFDVAWPANFDKDIKTRGQFIRARRCRVGRNSSNDSGTPAWFKFASITCSTANLDRRISFKVTYDYTSNTKWGILNAHVRTKGDSVIHNVLLQFESNTGIPCDCFVAAYDATNGICELWCKITTTWALVLFEVLTECRRENSANYDWTLYDDVRTSGFTSAPTSGYTQITALNSGALMAYPVGSIYIAYNHVSPASLFGGTWTRISPYFLYATGETGVIGETGGEAEVKLTTAQLPAHSHLTSMQTTGTEASGYGLSTSNAGFTNRIIVTKASGTELSTKTTGSGTGHNNIPPFIKVSVWRRTA